MTFAAWCRGMRLSRAFTQIRSGQPMDDVMLSHGFESHSGFRTAFMQTFGKAPGKFRGSDCLRIGFIETPLGPMLAAASDRAVCQLEFADRRGLENSYKSMRLRFGMPVVPGDNDVLQQLRCELREYFGSERRDFTVPIELKGTPFQERVWRELQRIPFGKTASYEAIARKTGSATATRAVARANATNRVYLLVPCHRVIAKDGTLSGYGGGVWRKRLLLKFEATGALEG
jgi:AraC family transcriptional regulator of adaptative response/methylated-DNA-[protein]-cysteine methyltransferase